MYEISLVFNAHYLENNSYLKKVYTEQESI